MNIRIDALVQPVFSAIGTVNLVDVWMRGGECAKASGVEGTPSYLHAYFIRHCTSSSSSFSVLSSLHDVVDPDSRAEC